MVQAKPALVDASALSRDGASARALRHRTDLGKDEASRLVHLLEMARLSAVETGIFSLPDGGGAKNMD